VVSGLRNSLRWRLRHNEDLYQLLGRPDIAKCIKLRRLQCAGHIGRKDNTRIPKKSAEWKISRKETRRKTKSMIGRKCQDVFLDAVEYKRRLAEDGNICRQTIEEARAQCGLSRH
jgi:hypothetical protein